MRVSKDLFIIIRNGQYVVWNVRTHEQFEIDTNHLERLRALSSGQGPDLDDDISNTLKETGLLQVDTKNSNDSQSTTEHGDGWRWDSLSYLFHKGTQDIQIGDNSSANPKQWSAEYLDYCAELESETPEPLTVFQGDGIALPDPDQSVFDGRSFWDVATSRKTSRTFNGHPVTRENLSSVLWASFGPVHGTNWEDFTQAGLEITGMRKLCASGGGLHPIDTYPVIYKSDGIAPGLYAYDQKGNRLVLRRPGDHSKRVTELLYGQFFQTGLAFGVFLVGRFDKAWWKYKHSRAYRNVLMDVGHASQTFQLCATALGMQTWITGAFCDSEVNEFLGIDQSQEQSALFFVGAGYGDNQAIPAEIFECLESSSPVH